MIDLDFQGCLSDTLIRAIERADVPVEATVGKMTSIPFQHSKLKIARARRHAAELPLAGQPVPEVVQQLIDLVERIVQTFEAHVLGKQ